MASDDLARCNTDLQRLLHSSSALTDAGSLKGKAALIQDRLQQANEILKTIAQLQNLAKNSRIQLELTTIATRVQNECIRLSRREDFLLDSSNLLDLFDKDMERARGDAAYIEKLLETDGPEAKWPH